MTIGLASVNNSFKQPVPKALRIEYHVTLLIVKFLHTKHKFTNVLRARQTECIVKNMFYKVFTLAPTRFEAECPSNVLIR